jgi:hypothetical protein
MFRRTAVLLALSFAFLPSGSSEAQEALQFFKNYFVTGGYAAGGVSLRGTGVGGVATDDIPIAGIPPGADILAAFLYWETIVTQQNPDAGVVGATFRGNALTPGAASKSLAKALNPAGTAPCWSSGGGAGGADGAHRMVAYRADVLRFIPIDRDVSSPTFGKHLVNGLHTVALPDSGSGNSVPSTAGASLLVVYRDPSMPLAAVVIYDGGYTMDQRTQQMTRNVQGFYQASSVNPVAQMTHLVGDGQENFSERLMVNGEVVATNPFVGPSWDTRTFDVELPEDASSVTISVDKDGNPFDCLSWGAIVFSTTVQDSDHDGLLDVWETTSGLQDPDGRLLPDLAAMGADPAVQDIFVEIGFMESAGYSNPAQGLVPAHSHLPALEALHRVATVFRNAAPRLAVSGPINIHFDVGANYQAPAVIEATGLPYPALPTRRQCRTSWQPACAIIPASLARGGEAIQETACVPGAVGTCQFPDYPGTVGWKSAYRFYRDQPLDPDVNESVCAERESNGQACDRRFDRSRKDIFRYALWAHALGLSRAETDDPSTPLDESHTPKNTSGIADSPAGGDLMMTLGFWDDFVGTPFMQASTFLHELGHTLGLRHGSAPFEPNCKPNYQSVMNYLFQVQGLIPGAAGSDVPDAVADYSRQVLRGVDESSLSETDGLGSMLYRTRWYAPLSSSFIDAALGTTPSAKRCNGTPAAPGEDMVRVEGTSPVAPLDWNADGVVNGTATQDVNFSGPVADQPFTALNAGADDYVRMDLRQVGGRRNVGSKRIQGGLSLDVGFGDVGFGDVGFGDVGFGDVGFGDVGFGDVGYGDVGFGDVGFGDVGFGDVGAGDLGFGDVGAPRGELDLDTARALGNAPNTLTATVGRRQVTLRWKPPHVGTVLSYEVYRVTGGSVTPANFAARVAIGTPWPLAGTTLTAVDETVKNRATYTYFVVANIDDGTRSGVSNFVTKTIR